MILSLIAAIGKNNELGKDNQLLWKLPDDFKHFKDITSGHTVIMGRKTFASIGRPLPNRRNIVITRDTTFTNDGIEVVHSLEDALELVQNENEVFVIGGAQIYNEALPYANKLYMTHIDGTFDADTFFPVIDRAWQQISEEKHVKDEQHLYDFSFVEYKKAAQ